MYSDIIQGIRAQKRRFIAKAITIVENHQHVSEKLLSEIYPFTGNAYRIGITGPPGAGKSSLTDKIIKQYRAEKKSVAVVGIDPTSLFTGGAILGDRIRMLQHHQDPKVYIRSMASRGSRGGLSKSSIEVGDILDAAGYDIIIFETVGVGQVELDVIQSSDTVVVVLVPESGDDIQMMKAGLMEIADIFAINKSDRSGADKLNIALSNMLSVLPHDENSWIPKVTKTVALYDKGTQELLRVISEHKLYINENGLWQKKLDGRYTQQVKDVISQRLQSSFWNESTEAILQKELSVSHNERRSPYQLSDYLNDPK